MVYGTPEQLLTPRVLRLPSLPFGFLCVVLSPVSTQGSWMYTSNMYPLDSLLPKCLRKFGGMWQFVQKRRQLLSRNSAVLLHDYNEQLQKQFRVLPNPVESARATC
jgi:hypothetical protein